jgi:predicted TIM-barrel fold metal-dependent hydrolase
MTTPWLEVPPSEVITKHILLTTQPIEEPDNADHLTAILGMFDAAHMLMFSSDFPHWDGDTPDFAARSIPAHLKDRVMRDTAIEVYGLKETTHA